MAYRSNPLELLSPVHESPELRGAMDSFLKYWLSKHELADNCLLYHYTTLAGLRGILESRSLWCGHSSSLNDPLEIQYGQQIIGNILVELITDTHRIDIRTFLQKMLVQVQAFGKHMFHTFVACFCESENLLSQWRGYTNNGRGYCVGIEFSMSTRIASNLSDLKNENPLILRKVVYNKDEQQKLVQKYINQIKDAVIKSSHGFAKSSEDRAQHASVMAMQAANVLLDMLLSFKHPAFESENEWRLIRVTREDYHPEELKFRETSNEFIPYRSTYIFDESQGTSHTFPLRSICFGPMLEPIRTHSAIELLLYHIAADNHPIALIPHLVQISGPGYSLR